MFSCMKEITESATCRFMRTCRWRPTGTSSGARVRYVQKSALTLWHLACEVQNQALFTLRIKATSKLVSVVEFQADAAGTSMARARVPSEFLGYLRNTTDRSDCGRQHAALHCAVQETSKKHTIRAFVEYHRSNYGHSVA